MRDTENTQILRNLERKNGEEYYLILLKKSKSPVETIKKEKKWLNWESSAG